MPVFDDLLQKNPIVLRRSHPAWNLGETDLTCRRESTFAGDNPVAVGVPDVANRDRLEDPELTDGSRQLFNVTGWNPFARLIRIGLNSIQLNQKGSSESPTTCLVGRDRSGGVTQCERRPGRERFRGGGVCAFSRSGRNGFRVQQRTLARFLRHEKNGNEYRSGLCQ